MQINQWSLRSRLTIGIVVLSAIGFATSFAGASNLLKNYLIHQVDDELNSVGGTTALRIDRGATIANNENVPETTQHNEKHEAAHQQPIQRIPTGLS